MRAIVPIEHVPQYVGPADKSVRINPEDYVGWIGPTGHVICYPIRAGELYNLFIGHVSEAWQEESWTAPSTSRSCLRRMPAGTGVTRCSACSKKTEETYKWGIYDREPLDRWTKGACDAAGRCGAPDDADAGAGAPRSPWKTPTRWRVVARSRVMSTIRKRALKLYENERIDRARRVQLQARQQFQNNRKVQRRRRCRASWIFEHDATSLRTPEKSESAMIRQIRTLPRVTSIFAPVTSTTFFSASVRWRSGAANSWGELAATARALLGYLVHRLRLLSALRPHGFIESGSPAGCRWGRSHRTSYRTARSAIRLRRWSVPRGYRVNALRW